MSNNSETLQYAIDSGIIDITCLQHEIEMKKRKDKIEAYKYKIWQGSNGYWYTYIDDSGGKKLVKKKCRDDLDDVIVKASETSADNPTVEAVFKSAEARRVELKKISEATAYRDRKIFKRHFGEFGKRRIRSITPADICTFMEEQLAEYDLTSKAFSNLKCLVRQIFKYARKNDYVSFGIANMFDDLDVSDREFHKSVKEDKQEVYDEDELDTLISYLTENPDIVNLGILLICVTGMRVGEMVSLKHEDIISDTAIAIRRTESYYMKDGKHIYEVKDAPKTDAGIRTVVIPTGYEWILKKIRLANPFGEYLFCRNGKRITASAVRDRLTVINKKLGIYQKSPHKLRKTYGTILLDNGLDNRLVVELMGHSNISVTENHYHINRRSLAKKQAIVSGLPEFSVTRCY